MSSCVTGSCTASRASITSAAASAGATGLMPRSLPGSTPNIASATTGTGTVSASPYPGSEPTTPGTNADGDLENELKLTHEALKVSLRAKVKNVEDLVRLLGLHEKCFTEFTAKQSKYFRLHGQQGNAV